MISALNYTGISSGLVDSKLKASISFPLALFLLVFIMHFTLKFIEILLGDLVRREKD